ncbi:DUF6011 domain-containing protein [Mycobacterium mantenii]|uniref:DUF6011 domain-containing protein n=1 Tax=Mycobacterium mantenii TaxID=560555 RepID=UPI003558E1AE
MSPPGLTATAPIKEDRPPENRKPTNSFRSYHATTTIADSTVRCSRCRRPLCAPLSVARSSGPICWRHSRVEAAGA